jgi:hypothetical protein
LFYGGAGTYLTHEVYGQASSVNRFRTTSTATSVSPLFSAVGSDANISIRMRTQGTGSYQFETGSSGNEQLRIANTASAVNYVQVTGAATGVFPLISAQGSDANIGLTLASKGTQAVRFNTNGTDQQFRISNTTGSDSFIEVKGGSSATGGAYVTAAGTARNLYISSGAANPIRFFTGGEGTTEQFRIAHAASAVNYLQVTGAATGFGPVLSAQGTDTNIPVVVQPKGTGALQAQQTDSTATGGNARGANAVDWQTLRDAASKVASGTYSTISGGKDNTSSNWAAVVGGGEFNNAGALDSTVAGGNFNSATGVFSAIVGGGGNNANGYYNFVGGGQTNTATANAAVTTQSATMNGTTAVTLSGSNASIKVGQLITGTSIAGQTYVAAISGTSLTLSKVASGSSTSTLSFFTPHGVVVGGGNNQATGSYSFIGGGGDAGTAANRNVASGDWSFVGGGKGNIASGNGAVVVGGGVGANNSVFVNTSSSFSSFVGGGIGHTASNTYSTILGGAFNSASGISGVVVAGRFATDRGISGNTVLNSGYNPMTGLGTSQTAVLILARQTTDATPTVLLSDSGSASATNQIALPNNSAYFFRGEVVSGVTGGGNTKGWTIEGVIKRGANAASTTLVGTPTVTSSFADAGASTWVIAVTADTTNGGLAVTFTGQAGTTIRTVAKIETTEMTF